MAESGITSPDKLNVAGGASPSPAPSPNGKKKRDDWNEPMVLDADYREIPLTLRVKDKEDPNRTVEKQFVLRDCDGPKRGAMIAFCQKVIKIDPVTGQATPTENTEESDVKIISFCLYTITGIPVAEEEIVAMALPGRILSKIAMRCMKICDFDADAEDREKKS